MTHGGNRQGAGRKKKTSNKLSLKEIWRQVEEDQTQTPLDIMKGIMRKAYAAGMYELALKAALAAAPYLHARVTEAAENARIGMQLEDMTDEQLEELAKRNGRVDQSGVRKGAGTSQGGENKPH